MRFYTKESLETLRDRVDLVEVIGSHVDLKRSGASFKGLCPFHDEKSPSFTLQRGDRHFHCFGCGAHGDAIQFLTQHVRLSFSDAVENLAARFHVKLEKVDGVEGEEGPPKQELKRALELATEFFQFHLLHSAEGKRAREYLQGRGIDETFIEAFDIGWAPERGGMLRSWLGHKKVSGEVMQAAGLVNRGNRDFFSGRIQFPIKDVAGAVIGFSGRKIREETFGGKYINTPETPLFKKSKVLFGLDQSRKRIAKERQAVIVEGQLDCLRLIYAGLNFTVAGQGTAFGEGHARELIHLGVQKVFLALDADPAGLEAAVKIGNLFQKAGVEVRVVELPKGDDPDSFLKREGAFAFLRRLEESGGYLPFVVRQESRAFDSQTPSGKASLVAKIADQIKKWDSPLMVHESLRHLAELTQVPEEFVGVGEILARNPLVRRCGVAGQTEINPDKILEGDLICWLIYGGHPPFAEVASKYLQAADFYSPVCREIYQALTSGNLSLLSPDAQVFVDELSRKRLKSEKKKVSF